MGYMNKNKPEYSVQPAYNENFMANSPASYADSVASPLLSHNLSQLSYDNQPDLNPTVPTVALTSAPIINSYPTAKFPVVVGPKSCYAQCSNCCNYVHTEITKVNQKAAHYFCFLFFICGCCLCSCIPYFMEGFKDTHHSCPECGFYIGRYSP